MTNKEKRKTFKQFEYMHIAGKACTIVGLLAVADTHFCAGSVILAVGSISMALSNAGLLAATKVWLKRDGIDL